MARDSVRSVRSWVGTLHRRGPRHQVEVVIEGIEGRDVRARPRSQLAPPIDQLPLASAFDAATLAASRVLEIVVNSVSTVLLT